MPTHRATRRTLWLAVSIVLIAVVGNAGAASLPAAATPSATPPPFHLDSADVHITSAGTPAVGYDTTHRKTATASCPDNERVLGGGARVTTPTGASTSGHVMLEGLVPGTTTYHAEAVEYSVAVNDTYPQDWRLIAYAICAPVPSTLGVEVVSRTSDTDSLRFVDGHGWVNDVAAPCPTGKRVIGTGGEIIGSFGVGDEFASFEQIRPNQQGAYTFVQVLRDRAILSSTFGYDVRAHSVCAYPIDGWRVAIDGTALNTARIQYARSECDGQQIIGGGLTKGDSMSTAHVESVQPDRSRQRLTAIGGIPSTSPTSNWNLAAWAICVDL